MKAWELAATAYERALESAPKNVAWLSRLGSMRLRAGAVEGAIEAFEMAVALEPTSPKSYLKLGRVHERHGPRTTHRTAMGLRVLPGDLLRASEVYERGILACAPDARLHYRRGLVELRLGSPSLAEEAFRCALEIDPTRAKFYYRLGRALRSKYYQRGGTLPGEVDEEAQAYRSALSLDPDHRWARSSLVDTCVRHRRWAEAVSATAGRIDTARESQLAGFLQAPGSYESPDVRRWLQGYLEGTQIGDSRVPTDWWYILHARLVDSGAHSLSHSAKQAYAISLLNEGRTSEDSVDRVRQAQALAYIGDLDQAINLLNPAGTQSTLAASEETLLRMKLHADLSLLRGEVHHLRDLMPVYAGSNLGEADARFRDMVKNRDVCIVGPSPPRRRHGDEIDSADTVIRPKVLSRVSETDRPYIGSRTDIAYYSSTVSRRALSDIDRLLSAEQLRMAVLRPSQFTSRLSWLRQPGDLRYSHTEYSGMLRATPLGILRAIYDVLWFQPRSITVYHADLFTGRRSYRGDYVSTEALTPTSNVSAVPLLILAHDFLADFLLIQSLSRHGYVGFAQPLAEVLSMTATEYLRQLDSRGVEIVRGT